MLRSLMFKSILGCALAFLLAFPAAADSVKVASFNIQFLGHFKHRDNEALAKLMEPYDLVFVQELVAPPGPGWFPDGSAYKPDNESKAFFKAMASQGFSYILSEEDTGTGSENHLNSSATEWFVAFYKPFKACPVLDLPHGFLAIDHTDNPDFERVPYAFPFKVGESDLVFISVHLMPGGGPNDRARRAHEFRTIFEWINSRPSEEKDFVVLGDMNIEDCDELTSILAPNFTSLNSKCLPTNTNVARPKPYDHVLYNTVASAKEISNEGSFEVINLIEAMREYWPASEGAFPGDPYDHNNFRQRYSDHHPVAFMVVTDGPDDD